jgi:hypothetical protein
MITMPIFDRFALGKKGKYAGKPGSNQVPYDVQLATTLILLGSLESRWCYNKQRDMLGYVCSDSDVVPSDRKAWCSFVLCQWL